MKNYIKHSIFNAKTLIIGILLIVASLSFALFGNAKKTQAEGLIEANLFMPYTELEFDKSLSSPSHVYWDEDILAVVQNKPGSPGVFELLISKNGNKFSCANSTFTMAINHIKRLSDKYLLVSSDSIVYAVDVSGDLQNPTITPLTKKDSSIQVTCTEFDYKDGILVTSWETSYSIYTVDTQTLVATTVTSGDSTVKEKTPVCLGDDALFFLDGNNNLMKRTVTKQSTSNNTETIIEDFSVDKMISKGDYLYAKKGSDVYKISISKKTATKMTFVTDENYQLSSVATIGGMCFKGDDILITDSASGTVQQFKIDDNSLTFTGYAIAHGKTAFNRFGVNVDNIEQNGNMIATIDNATKNFTLVSDVNGSYYSRDNFKFNACFDKGAFTGFTPNAFALGTKSVLFVDKTAKKARVFDLKNNLLLSELDFSEKSEYTSITDVTFQSGKYYISQLKARATTYDVVIYSGTEDDLLNGATLNEMLTVKNSYDNITLPVFTVDVFQNVYLTNTQLGCVYKYEKTENGYGDGVALTNARTSDGIIKLCTDLAGGLFILDNDGIYYYDQQAQEKYSLTFASLPSSSISSFSMSMDKSQVYLTFDGEQFIYSTSDLPTYSLDKLNCPNEFVISSNQANDISNLKTCQIANNANIYAFDYKVVNGVKSISYDKLISLNEPLIFICQFESNISFGDSVSRNEVFYMLSGKSEDGKLLTAIVNKRDATLVTPEIGAVKETFAYTTTGVSVYFLPVITKDADHVLKVNGESVILNKNVKITTYNTITLFGVEYYFASVTLNDNTYIGYIPSAFTTKVLSKDFKEEKFTVESVNETKVYSSSDLSAEIASLSQNATIRLYEHDNGVARIGYSVDGEWLEGYIAYEKVIQTENNVIRNVLIILAITISVCVTSLYFILRKK